MKTFKKGNWSHGAKCPICNSSKEGTGDGEIILIPKEGTGEGFLYESIQVHTSCLGDKLMYYPKDNIIAIKCK